MRILYRITLDHLYNGWPLSSANWGDGPAYNPVALAMNAVHGDDSVVVQYEKGRLTARLGDTSVELPPELCDLLDAHRVRDTDWAQPVTFTVEYQDGQATARMGAGDASTAPAPRERMWHNDGGAHNEIGGDCMCPACADACEKTEEDPHPRDGPGLDPGHPARAGVQLLRETDGYPPAGAPS